VKKFAFIFCLSVGLGVSGQEKPVPSNKPASASPTPVQQHWSFVPPKRPAPPVVQNSAWICNPIDAFILAPLEKEKTQPSSAADRWTLIRRLSLDLRGLPPSAEEVEAFIKDQRPDAYEQLVDGLLASPHFGERWGRHWLDLARYADSDGYEKDSPRPYAYLFRDWVIDAINRDLPFDEFSIEQLAGDLLPNATEEKKIGTGFHRNTLTNKEGGVDQEEFRCKATVDRVSTTGTVWLGLTVGCAECHNHKYDPISQREFYQLYAFFNNASEKDIPAPRPDELAKYNQQKLTWDHEQARRREALNHYLATEAVAKQADWEGTLVLPRERWTVLKPAPVSATGGATLRVQSDQSVRTASKVSAGETTYSVEVKTLPDGITGFRLEVWEESVTNKAPARGKNEKLVFSEFTVQVRPPSGLEASSNKSNDGPNLGTSTAKSEIQNLKSKIDQSLLGLAGLDKVTVPTNQDQEIQAIQLPGLIPLQNASADHASKGRPVEGVIDGNLKTSWAIDPPLDTRHLATFETKEDLNLPEGSSLIFRLHQPSSGSNTISHFRISATHSPRPFQPSLIPDSIVSILEITGAQRTEPQKAELAAYFRDKIDPGVQKLRQQLTEHAKAQPKFPETKAQAFVENEQPRKTQIHIRGDFLRKGDEVLPLTPAVLPPFQARPKAGGASALSERPDRLDLARWLFDPANPLTARVAVNRVWYHLFGRGLVTSMDDFGKRGERPSHPELLDWLATEFPKLGWSRKALIKLIVTSAAYRQSSHLRPDLAERDPNNIWLARQNRFRLEAENVRDACLAVGGLLNSTLGGPPIRPQLPADIAALGYANSVKWKESEGTDRYRRGLYIFFQRTVPYPMLTTFDAPDSNATCTRRERSNTPLQALTLLNDPVFFECAQALGHRMAHVPGATLESKIRRGFSTCLSREPTAEETERLAKLYQEFLRAAQSNLEQAGRVAGITRTESSNVAEVAALIGVGRIILNLDEFVTRE
jgi:hypothetical protein